MLPPFRLISASLKEFSRDITNDIIVKQNIRSPVIFVKLRISKNSLEEGHCRN